MAEKQNIDLNYIEIESKTSSVQARPLKPRIPKQTKEKKPKAQIKKPSLSHKGKTNLVPPIKTIFLSSN